MSWLVKCDLHGTGFMRAWIIVASHPFHALIDDEGRFRIPDVPKGPNTLEVRRGSNFISRQAGV